MINKVYITLHETQNHAEQRVLVARTPKMVRYKSALDIQCVKSLSLDRKKYNTYNTNLLPLSKIKNTNRLRYSYRSRY